MITEALMAKAFMWIGAWTISTKVIVPVTELAGTALGHGAARLVSSINRKGRKTRKEKVETNEAKEQQILALLQECDEAFSENDIEKEPIKTEPTFDQKTLDWIQKCKNQYGGFIDRV